MDKYSFIDLFNNQLNNSKIFIPGSTNLWKALKYFFDDAINIDEIFIKMQWEIKIAFKKANGKINMKEEKDILDVILQLTKRYISEIIHNWFTEKEKDEAKAFLAVCSFKNVNTQIGLICLVFFSSEENKIENEKKTLRLIELPEELKLYLTKDDLINVDDFQILDRGYYKKEYDIVIYPDFNSEIREKINQLDPDKAKIQIRPKSYCKFSEYNPIEAITEARMFGMPFDKKYFKNIFTKNYGSYEYVFDNIVDNLMAKAFYVPLNKLEYVIKPYENNMISLSLEETIDITKHEYLRLPYFYFIDRNNTRFLKQKYLHMIIDKNTAEIIHLDLSYLYYLDDKIELRSKQHIKDKVVSADYKKKIVRIDAKESNTYFTEFNLFTDLACSLMGGYSNPEIIKFFNGL